MDIGHPSGFDRAAYDAFLAAKAVTVPDAGFDLPAEAVNPMLFRHQPDIVRWAVKKGRAAIFASFGLGKTVMQLEIERGILAKVGPQGRGLIVMPLGVRQEFARDAAMLGIPVRFIRRSEEVDGGGIYLTNYESVREGKVDPDLFDIVSLDEAAVLRGFGGTKTFRELMRMFGNTTYRIVATATPSPNEYIELLAYAAFLGVMEVGEAKAQPLTAKVLTPSGWRLMGDIKVGDMVIAGDGSPTKVLGVYPQGEKPIFRVTFADGSCTEATGDHLWVTSTAGERTNEARYLARNGADAPRKGSFCDVRTTAAIADTLRWSNGQLNHAIPIVGAVQFPSRPVAVDPWLLGALLGDANLRETAVTFSNPEEWMLARVRETLPPGLELRKTATAGACDYGITTTGTKGGKGPGSNPLLAALRSYGLLGARSHEKWVPEEYLLNEPLVRLKVLRGLMDTDGTVHADGRTQSLTTTSPRLVEDALFLVRSLGGTGTVSKRETGKKLAYKITIRMPEGVAPFSLPRKAERVRWSNRNHPQRLVESIEEIGAAPAQCIAVEHPSRLYVTDDFVVTHNTRFFKRDSSNADKLTLHPHKEAEFWQWVGSWAVFCTRPSDLGHDDTGYDLPPVDIRWHEVPSDHTQAGEERDGQIKMFRDAAVGVSAAAAEKRNSLPARIATMQAIRAEEPEAHRIIWHDLEAEREAIEAAIPGIASAYGSQDLDARERVIMDFANGAIPELAVKPSIAGTGCNFQRHCARAIFLGIGFKFHEFIQALHRIVRFGQAQPVRIDLIYTEAEREIRRALEAKWARHVELVEIMRGIVRQHGLGLAGLRDGLRRTLAGPRQVAEGERWRLVNDDTVVATAELEPDSVGLMLTSIPFATQYEYTPTFNDFGHTDDNAHFWRQMDFLTPSLLRALMPGRVLAVHVKDRITPGGINGFGFQTLHPFSDEAVAHYTRHGFAYLARITITTDVVRENNQTYRLGWTEQCKDGSRMGVGVPEYLLLFRKPPTDRSTGYADTPVVKDKPLCADHGEPAPFDPKTNWRQPVPGTGYSRARWQLDAHGFHRSSGNRLLTPEELRSLPHEQLYKRWREYCRSGLYSHEDHVRVCEQMDAMERLPSTFMQFPPHSIHDEVWTDIARMRTLNAEQVMKGKEVHLCPLQEDICDRTITRFSMPDELVYDPFAGIGSVPVRAVLLGRRGAGAELSPRYWADAVGYLRAAEAKADTPTLFDLAGIELDPANDAGRDEVAA